MNYIGLINCQSGDFKIHLTDSISQFENDWKMLVSDQSLLSVGNCRVCESSAPNNFSYRYAIAYHQGKPVMCAMFQLIRITPENLRAPEKKKFIHYATDLMLQIHEINVLVCGNVFKDGMVGFHYNPSTFNPNGAEEVLSKIIDKLTKEESISTVMLKDMPEDFNWPQEGKVLKLENDISMAMPIAPEWSTLQDYLSALSKKYATRAKKILASAQGMEVKLLSEEDLVLHQDNLHALYKQVLSRQSFTFGVLDKGYFSLTKQLLKDKFSVFGLFLDQQMVGFFSTISGNDTLEVHYIGLDYAFNQTHNLYFNIHFLVLEQAILAKKKQLKMGRTTLEAKAILGCKPVYHHTYLCFKKPLAECAFTYFSKNISESDSWKTRNPLKEIVAAAETVATEAS